MAGHSKWSNIKRKKGAADQKRGKIFTRLIHEIVVSVREGGGGDPQGNARLRLAIDKAKAANMPNATIDRAIKRATGEIKGEEQHEITYEGYGPGGTAVLVHVLTDNKNRTVGEVRNAFSRSGGSLGEANCVAWMFDKKGVIVLKKNGLTEEQVMETALEAGAEDISDENEYWEVTCDMRDFAAVREVLEAQFEVESAEITDVPKSTNPVDQKDAEKLIRLLETLEDLDDVLSVSANADFEDQSA